MLATATWSLAFPLRVHRLPHYLTAANESRSLGYSPKHHEVLNRRSESNGVAYYSFR